MIAAVTSVLLLALILLLPVRWAASFADADEGGWGTSVVAAVAGPAVSFLVYRLLSAGFAGLVLAFVAGIAAYVLIFRIPARKIPAFTIVVIALQMAVLFGLLSFGVNLGQATGGRT